MVVGFGFDREPGIIVGQEVGGNLRRLTWGQLAVGETARIVGGNDPHRIEAAWPMLPNSSVRSVEAGSKSYAKISQGN